jgi:AcrR family transcriptional regulator
MARSPLKKKSGSAAEDILCAAERLFGEEGISSISLRHIASAANQVNNFAVQYHFGDKEGLIRAIFQRRLPFVEHRRRRMLDEAHRTGLTVEKLIEATFRPIVDEVDKDGRRTYARFLAQIVSDKRTAPHWLEMRSLVPTIDEISQQHARLCPALDAQQLVFRLQLVNILMLQAIYLADEDGCDMVAFEAIFMESVCMASAAMQAR